MAKKNVVLEGRYKGREVYLCGKNLLHFGIDISKECISSYEVIDETNKNKYSFWKGALGVAIFGGIGVVAGIGGKSKEYLVAIEWADRPKHPEGTRSLVSMEEKYYKVFVRTMF